MDANAASTDAYRHSDVVSGRVPLTTSSRWTSPRITVAICTMAILTLGGLGPRGVRADDSESRGGVEGDEITADAVGGGNPTPNPDKCSWRSVTRPNPATGGDEAVTRRRGSDEQVLMAFDCEGPPPRAGRKWITRRPASGGSRASARRRLPAPGVSLAPAPDRGVVNVGSWFWASRAVWKPWSVSATVVTPAGPVTVTTTARPSRLIFDPGDGHSPVSCSGPGTAWTAAYGDRLPSRCMYTYRRASTDRPGGTYAASLSIVWRVTWRSSLGAGGRLPDVHTTTRFPSLVREIQAIAAR